MRHAILGLIFLSMTGAAYGQIGVPSGPFSALSNSVIDHNGNLIVFDASYSYSANPNQAFPIRFPPTVKTHVSVITIAASGATKTSFDYDGAFQLVGVGRRAVYAIVSAYTVPTTAMPIAVNVARRLVALNAVAGTLPTSLPSIDLLSGDDVKISADDDGSGAETIALIGSSLAILPPIAFPGGTTTTTSTSASHSIRLFTFDGGSFTKINQTPISLP